MALSYVKPIENTSENCQSFQEKSYFAAEGSEVLFISLLNLL